MYIKGKAMTLQTGVRLSTYFLPTMRDVPADSQIASHRLMLRAGMIRQETSGIYSWLPLGLRVLRKVENVVREEQNNAGAIEILMPTVQSADLWKTSGRYDDYGKEMLRITDRHDRELLFGPTNEEMVTDLFKSYCTSYKDLPRNLYHIQWKFRDEIRPRFGVMRGREFLMKDAYSFDLDEASARESYNKMFVAYLRTFARLGVKAIPMRADTGPIGGDLSHEFIILAETGESEVFCDSEILEFDPMANKVTGTSRDELQGIVDKWTTPYAATEELHDADAFADVPSDRQVSARGIEVGHIFYFGEKYSEPFKFEVDTPNGKARLHMGSYGVGVSRLLGAIIEAFHDDAGIKWPDTIAPFSISLINLRVSDDGCNDVCEGIFEELTAAGIDVIYDDRDMGAGAKFKDAELIGIPYQIVIGPKGLEKGIVEFKCRHTGDKQELSREDVIALIKSKYGK